MVDDTLVAHSLSHNDNQGNTSQVNGNIDVIPPTLRSVAESHINKAIADVRARIHQNIKSGLDLDAAIDEIDAMAASLMVDRWGI